MSSVSAHPERLLLALDEALDHEVHLILYGRSAIWLGFDNPPAAAATTQDVDAIIPNDQVQALADDLRFWDARDAVNERFKSEGLYITHLFPENDVFLSAASAWEIAQKYSRGKLVLPEPPERCIPFEREARAIASLAIDEESTLHASRLPFHHRDPFDRLIVSQAIVHGLTILTPDPLISRYSARVIW